MGKMSVRGVEGAAPMGGFDGCRNKKCIASAAYAFKAEDIARAIEAKLKEKNGITGESK